MTKLFTVKASADLRSVNCPIRLTQEEARTIRHSASIRNMSVAEFMRRAALARKADVNYETQIVLELSDIIRAIRAIHKQMVEMQIAPPEEIWSPLIDEAIDAILRVGN